MKLKEAIKRLGFTISKGNKPNQTDAEAYNEIIKHLQQSEAKTIQENLLFAKLYTYLLGKLTPHYKSVDEANKHLNKLLYQSMDVLIDTLLMEVKAMELKQILPDPIISELSPEKTRAKLAQYPKIEKDFIHAWNFWDKDNVTAHLKANINLSIQNFKNNV